MYDISIKFYSPFRRSRNNSDKAIKGTNVGKTCHSFQSNNNMNTSDINNNVDLGAKTDSRQK